MSSSKYLKVRLRRTGLTGNGLRPIPGYENYLADSCGKIYVYDRRGRARQLTQFLAPNSRYLRVYLTRNNVKKNFYVHNLVLSAYRNYNPEKIKVVHLDRNYFNNRLINLRLNNTAAFERLGKADAYRIECLEEELKEKAGYDKQTALWQNYLGIKRTRSAKTVINWLAIVLKSL